MKDRELMKWHSILPVLIPSTSYDMRGSLDIRIYEYTIYNTYNLYTCRASWNRCPKLHGTQEPDQVRRQLRETVDDDFLGSQVMKKTDR